MSEAALVDPGWLADHLTDPGLVVCDASSALPGEAFDSARAFRDAHVAGARFLDLALFADPDTSLPHMIPSQGRFARLAGVLGIGNDTTLVLYDSRRLFSAPRAWFLFRLFDLAHVHVLDGGLPAWTASGGAIESGDPPPAVPARFVPRLRAGLLAGLGDIERLAAGEAVILDARSSERFDGTGQEPRPGIRSGHIPGSENLPYGALLEQDGRLKTPEELRALFASHGVTGERPVVTSCGTGVTAAILTLGLHTAGIPSRLFDGSWTEYALAHPDDEATR